MIECLAGITDLHPGTDGLAALRDSQELRFDLLKKIQNTGKLIYSNHQK